MRIFVSIAAYRDIETQDTIRDLFDQARHPARINVGVCAQVAPDDPPGCVPRQSKHVKMRLVHAQASRGPCWARSRILTELFTDEDFVLQIDSHMRFEPGWDESLLNMWRQLNDERGIISCYPVGYTPPRTLGTKLIPILRPKEFSSQGILLLNSDVIPYAQRPKAPIPNHFVAAGFVFAPALAFRQVPYDPYLYFHGEEISLSARLFTHGWNTYAPNDVILYHNYHHNSRRPKHWEDQRHWTSQNRRSVDRVKALLSGKGLTYFGAYGLGQQRSLQAFETETGVSFSTQTIAPKKALALVSKTD